MSNELTQGLLENYRSALRLVADVIGQFDEDQWLEGDLQLHVPWQLSYHIVDALDYYFREDAEQGYVWGHRFGGGWWELADEEAPRREQMLRYLEEVEKRVVKQLSSLEDRELRGPFDSGREHGETRLAHYVYGLRHTMHHHGALSLLSLQFGNEEGLWE